ncbi:MAG: DUF1673 family protein [ANME-2 cluster archaeon]|nr:DUF1673 family protein [ANME-2 cluster archaeon]MBC2706459.1 DUF1673 family protein [ANME-2 cluster archaeon]MBC2747712.1 DUF1673 family protein [ANME-2 cluster archaeon]
MTAVAEHIKKMMGWCPHPDLFVTKRTLITMPSDEFLNSEKDKGKMVDPVKMGLGNRYQNIVLLTTLAGIVGLGVNILILIFLFGNIHMGIMMKAILIGTIITPFFIYYEWKRLNRIDQIKSFRTKIVYLKIFVEMVAFWTPLILLYFTIGKDGPLEIMLGYLLPIILVLYPLVVYWERKNKKIIYLVEEEKPFRWRPVVLEA